MRRTTATRIWGATALAVALVAHLWMFATAGPAHERVTSTATVAAPGAQLAGTSCPGDMDGCEAVLDPSLLLLLVAAVLTVGTSRRDREPDQTLGMPATRHLRGPPRTPVASRVLLLE